jgi:hypothetical protein
MANARPEAMNEIRQYIGNWTRPDPQSSENGDWQRLRGRHPERIVRSRKGRKIRSAPWAPRNGPYLLGRILPPQAEKLPPRGNPQKVVYAKTVVIESTQVAFEVCTTPGHRFNFIGHQIIRGSSAPLR